MTESCRLITEEQYKEWKASKKKLEELKQELDERFPYNCFSARLERERLQKKLEIALCALGIIAMHSKDTVDAVQAAAAIEQIKEVDDET